MSRWKVERRTGQCGRCERAFADGELHLSVLELTQEGLRRRDACRECWHREAPEGAPPRGQDRPGGEILERFWWGTRHQAEPEKAVKMDMEVLEQLFDALAERGEERLAEIRYVICLLLMRKRRVKLVRLVREQGREAFLVKKPRREEQHRVAVFDFGPERMEGIRHELQALLDGAGEDVDPVAVLEAADAELAAEAERGEATSTEEASEEAEPDDTAPEDTAPEDTAPEDTAPEEAPDGAQASASGASSSEGHQPQG
jgi:hypothetical protein